MDQHTSPGFIPIVMGGLGNQMFIVAAAYVASLVKQTPVYLLENSVENNQHNHLKQNYNDTIFKYIGVRLPIQQKTDISFQILQTLGYRTHIQNGFQPWNPSDTVPGMIFSSYYQFYPALAPFESELRSVFLQGLQPYRDTFKGNDLSRSAFLHIRRGDYVKLSHIHYLQNFSYYQTCVLQLLTKVGFEGLQTIYVTSDDMEWVRNQPFFQNTLFTFYESKDELMTLAMMSLCQAGAICANSTFSWWGAFLGAYGARAPVFAPKRWIGGDSHPVALFPDEWTVI